MQKGVAGKWAVFAFDSTTNLPVEDDQANITANIYIDGVVNAVDDTNPTQLEGGNYVFDITATESGGNHLVLCPTSATADVVVIAIPGALWTRPPNFEKTSIDSSGLVATDVDSIEGGDATDQIEAAVQTVIENNKLDHLMAAADSDDVVDNSALAKMVSSTGDWSTFASGSDSLEALRDRGDQAWLTGAGVSGSGDSHTTTDWTRTTGDNDGGVPSDTLTVNGSYFSTGEVASGVYLQVDAVFTIGTDEIGVSLDIWAHYNGGTTHYINVLALDSGSSTYEPIGTIPNSAALAKYNFPISPNHTNHTGHTVTLRFLHGGGSGSAAHVFHVDKAQVNTVTDAITDGSNLTAIPWNSAWDAEVESEVTDAINVLGIPADLASVKGVTDALTVNGATSLALSVGSIVIGSVVAGTLSSTQMSTDLTEVTDDHYVWRLVIFTDGDLKDMVLDILSYNGTTGVITYSETPTGESPSEGDNFIII